MRNIVFSCCILFIIHCQSYVINEENCNCSIQKSLAIPILSKSEFVGVSYFEQMWGYCDNTNGDHNNKDTDAQIERSFLNVTINMDADYILSDVELKNIHVCSTSHIIIITTCLPLPYSIMEASSFHIYIYIICIYF